MCQVVESDRRYVEGLLKSKDPVVAYNARVLKEGGEDRSTSALREGVRRSDMARRLLSGRGSDGRIQTNAYRKWQGPHWTLVALAQIGYPPGDPELAPLRDQVYDWLLSPEHMKPPRTRRIEGQDERVRRCASQEGNTIWYSVALGLVDGRTRLLVDRLIELQWPDGGWNCDKRIEAHTSSIIESLIPLRGLMLYGRAFDYLPAVEAAERTGAYLLERRLLYRLHDGSVIRPTWGGEITKIHFPVQFYDVLFALVVMTEIGAIGDARCAEALKLLEHKRLPGGGFPAEIRNCVTANRVVSRGSFADWGPSGRRTANPLVSIQAIRVLESAARSAGKRNTRA